MITQNLSTHAPQALSTLEWTGLHSEKFKGGKFHLNHPKDELDSLLISSKSTENHPQGKKQFHSLAKREESEEFRPSLKTYDTKYKRSTVFDE